MAKILVVSTTPRQAGSDLFITDYAYFFKRNNNEVKFLRDQSEFYMNNLMHPEKNIGDQVKQFKPDGIVMSTASVYPLNMRQNLYSHLTTFDSDILVCEFQPPNKNDPKSYPFNVYSEIGLDPKNYIAIPQQAENVLIGLDTFVQRKMKGKLRT